MKILDLLRTAEIAPLGILGQGRIANRQEFLDGLRRHQRILGGTYLAACITGCVLAGGVLVVGMLSTSALLRGGGVLLAVLALVVQPFVVRHLVTSWLGASLPLTAAAHASDDQLAELIGGLIAAYGGGGRGRGRGPTPPVDALAEEAWGVAPSPAGILSATRAEPQQAQVVILCAPGDEAYLALLRLHLRPLEIDQAIEVWDTTQLLPGDRWRAEISSSIAAARVAILLVSAELLASETILAQQVQPLLRAAHRRGATIVSVVARPCSFANSPLAEFYPANSPDRALSKLRRAEREELLSQIAKRVIDILARRRDPEGAGSPVEARAQ